MMEVDQIAETHGDLLLDFVKKTLVHGMIQDKPPAINIESFPEELTQPGATFVTVEQEGRLRGCIGSLRAHRPLVEDLARNAFRAGFEDPRFQPLKSEEMGRINWSVSILSKPKQILFRDETDLLSRLKPRVDGLIISDMGQRATFLPQVWEQLPDPSVFLAHLKRKAGLAQDHWSPGFTALRYRVAKIG